MTTDVAENLPLQRNGVTSRATAGLMEWPADVSIDSDAPLPAPRERNADVRRKVRSQGMNTDIIRVTNANLKGECDSRGQQQLVRHAARILEHSSKGGTKHKSKQDHIKQTPVWEDAELTHAWDINPLAVGSGFSQDNSAGIIATKTATDSKRVNPLSHAAVNSTGDCMHKGVNHSTGECMLEGDNCTPRCDVKNTPKRDDATSSPIYETMKCAAEGYKAKYTSRREDTRFMTKEQEVRCTDILEVEGTRYLPKWDDSSRLNSAKHVYAHVETKNTPRRKDAEYVYATKGKNKQYAPREDHTRQAHRLESGKYRCSPEWHENTPKILEAKCSPKHMRAAVKVDTEMGMPCMRKGECAKKTSYNIQPLVPKQVSHLKTQRDVNSFVHAATGAVYGTSGCMHMGVNSPKIRQLVTGLVGSIENVVQDLHDILGDLHELFMQIDEVTDKIERHCSSKSQEARPRGGALYRTGHERRRELDRPSRFGDRSTRDAPRRHQCVVLPIVHKTPDTDTCTSVTDNCETTGKHQTCTTEETFQPSAMATVSTAEDHMVCSRSVVPSGVKHHDCVESDLEQSSHSGLEAADLPLPVISFRQVCGDPPPSAHNLIGPTSAGFGLHTAMCGPMLPDVSPMGYAHWALSFEDKCSHGANVSMDISPSFLNQGLEHHSREGQDCLEGPSESKASRRHTHPGSSNTHFPGKRNSYFRFSESEDSIPQLLSASTPKDALEFRFWEDISPQQEQFMFKGKDTHVGRVGVRGLSEYSDENPHSVQNPLFHVQDTDVNTSADYFHDTSLQNWRQKTETRTSSIDSLTPQMDWSYLGLAEHLSAEDNGQSTEEAGATGGIYNHQHGYGIQPGFHQRLLAALPEWKPHQHHLPYWPSSELSSVKSSDDEDDTQLGRCSPGFLHRAKLPRKCSGKLSPLVSRKQCVVSRQINKQMLMTFSEPPSYDSDTNPMQIFNPRVHAATGTVNSTDSCMYKGVSADIPATQKNDAYSSVYDYESQMENCLEYLSGDELGSSDFSDVEPDVGSDLLHRSVTSCDTADVGYNRDVSTWKSYTMTHLDSDDVVSDCASDILNENVIDQMKPNPGFDDTRYDDMNFHELVY